MGSKNKSDNLLTLEQDSILKENSLCDLKFENLSKFELLQKLKESKAHSNIVEEDNKKLQKSVSDLENALEEQCRKTKNLEEDKSFLRNNIKKASNNWFERKARLSEGENDNNDKIDTEIDEEIKETSKEPSVKKDWAQILIADETIKLFSELKFKDEQIELSERCCAELRKRVGDYEKVIDDQEVIIHGLENQLDTYFHDNKLMSKQLADLHKLFLDLEAINEKQVNLPVSHQDTASSTDHLPTSEEFKEMSGSVAKTYTKLKELIYEKKSLVTEIERLRTLNVELQNRVSQQETRLISVSDALQTTWLLVSNLKDEHEKIHTAETILRYELKEKREILNRLRDELECSREQWHIIRQKNSETEQEWAILREELNERRRLRIFAEVNGETITPEDIEGAVGLSKSPDNEFEPPIDLLVDMGIEYGVIEADDEESATVVALIDGEDVHEERLQNLEEQCCFLYQKLMSSTARALTLASHLSSLHEHYALSDGDDDDDDENENEQYFNEDEDDDGNAYESEVVSPDSESYDTAYVSEADGADSASVVADTNGSNGAANGMTEITGEESPELIDEGCDLLSRRLITFLPRKIEILRAENQKLEERLQLLQEDKTKIEERLNASVEFERRQRKQLEQQLSHLGKCVDELKLERNGKIEEVEAALQKKIEEVEIEEKEHIQLKDEHERLKEKYEERGALLQITASQLEQTVKQSEEKLNELQSEISNLKQEILREDKMTRSAFTQYENLLPFEMESSSTNNLQEADIPKITPHSLQKEQSTSICEENIKPETIFSNNQFKKLVLLTNSCLRIPVYLAENSTLCWSFHIVPQEIRFSITYDDVLRQDKCSSSSIDQHESDASLEPQQPEDDSKIAICSGVQISRELLPPHSVDASCSDVAGRLVPKVPGHYCLVFHNKIFESQELYVKIWMEESKQPVIQGD